MGTRFSERRKKILELIDRDGKVEVAVLFSILSISEITIRRDLEKLEFESALITDKRTEDNDVSKFEKQGLKVEKV